MKGKQKDNIYDSYLKSLIFYVQQHSIVLSPKLYDLDKNKLRTLTKTWKFNKHISTKFQSA